MQRKVMQLCRKRAKNLVSLSMVIILFICLIISFEPKKVEATKVNVKCNTISTAKTIVYSNKGLTKRYGEIWSTDEVAVNEVTDAWCNVTYPAGNKKKTGYIKTSAILTKTTGPQYKARVQLTTYKRPGGVSYGYISKNDSVKILGVTGGYTQVKYPINRGYKYAFVPTSAVNNYILPTASYATISGTYVLRSALNNSLVMDAYGGSGVHNGTNIQLYTYNGGVNQRFTITHVGNGWHKIICNWGNLSLDIHGASTADEANIELYGYHGSNNQLWRFVSAGNGYYYIQSALGNCIDVYKGYATNETNIQSYHSNGGNNQKWKLDNAGSNEVVEKAISWADMIARDNSHGYSMTNRYGNPDYDCSSFVCNAYNYAGTNVAIGSTPTMRADFVKKGFVWIPWCQVKSTSNLKRGDVLLNENSGKNGHTEIYLGNNRVIGARGGNRDGKNGDSYDTEICETTYTYCNWNGVLRYSGR